MLVTVNIKMTHVFKHPNYYKELRKRNKLAESRQPVVGGQQTDQAISCAIGRRPSSGRAPGPGLKLPGPKPISNANKGLIHRRQASSNKLEASSDKPQAASDKPQAASDKRSLESL